MEIGSFIELQLPRGREWHREPCVARLNTGRAAIWHAFRCLPCDTLWLPTYQCDTVREFLQKKGVTLKYYAIDNRFEPQLTDVADNEAVLVVNYYGVMSDARMRDLASRYDHVIVDASQAFFAAPVDGAMTVYSARKFVGVPDGAYVMGEGADRFLDEYEQDYSSDTAGFLFSRIEYGCEGKGYETRMINEHRIDAADIATMSKLTHRLLDAEDNEYNMRKRRENFETARKLLDRYNALDAAMYYDDDTVPMVYPLVVEDDGLLPHLQKHKLFQGHWWSYLLDEVPEDSVEYWLSRYVIPITIDQRYGEEELRYTENLIREYVMRE
ncbi:MAG: hypothetical protein IJC52_00530 [Clostridia bacterium]|nr:hypothetical protein [Clostridia bacterium]